MTATEVVDRVYAAMQARDVEGVLAWLTEDVLIVVPGPPGVGAAGDWHGHTGARECLRRLGEGQTSESLEMFERVAEGPYVVARLRGASVVRATGRRFESDIVHMFTVADGKVSRLLDFFDTAALVAAYRAD
jgi:ketosteroid isomerase-like protein